MEPKKGKQMANKKQLEYHMDLQKKNEAATEAKRLEENNDSKGIARV